MRKKEKTLLWTMIVGVIGTAVLGCPPGEPDQQVDDGQPPAPPEFFDFEHYWPFQVGNVWFLSSLYEEGNAFEYTVLEKFESKEASGWHLKFRKYSKTPAQEFERDEYLILLGDFLYHTFSKDKMYEVLDDPKNVQLVDQVHEFAPRFFLEGTNEIDGMPLFHTLAGHLKHITPFEECDGTQSIAEDFPIEPGTRTVIIMDKGYCGDPGAADNSAPGFGFGEHIGILYFYGHVLSYAYVDGVEYSFDS